MGQETDGPPPPCLTVLVADPSPENADSLALVLALCGHRARTAATAADALAATAADPPDVLITEALFPDGDGLALAEQVAAVSRGRPLLVLWTGRTVPRESLERARFDAHFLKPADPAALIALLGAHARRRQPGPLL
jgi:two-component system, OmpR family, response regulator